MYALKDYGDMIMDAVRMPAYEAALRAMVRPGARVLDLGSGTGILGLIAARLGAAHVHAIEPEPVAQVAREIAAANGLDRVITFHQALSRDVELPERVDLIVSDLRGILPFFRNSVATVIDARGRFLARGGSMIARSDSVWVAPVESEELFARVSRPWLQNEWGLDMRRASMLAANSLGRGPVRPDNLLAPAAHAVTLDYATVSTTDIEADVEFIAGRRGTGHGLAVWFDSELAPGITLSNAPGRPDLVYGIGYLPWPGPVAVEEGDRIAVRLSARLVGDDYIWSWRSQVGGGNASFRQSTFLGQPMSPVMLERVAADHVPGLGEEGEIDMIILRAMAEGATLRAIAERLARDYPRRFADWQAALAHVSKLSLRYGKREPSAP